MGQRVIRPREGWEHVGCPTCGLVTIWPTDRNDPAYCPHNGQSLAFGIEPAEGWTQVVPVIVVTVGSRTDRATSEAAWREAALALREAGGLLYPGSEPLGSASKDYRAACDTLGIPYDAWSKWLDALGVYEAALAADKETHGAE